MLTESLSAPVILEDYRESDRTSPHLAKIGGRFLSEGALSRNKRIYTGIAGWIGEAQSRIDAGETLTMLSHHDALDDSTRIVGKLTRLSPDGRYEGLVRNSPIGHDMLNLIEGGYLKHVSLRGGPPVQVDDIPQEDAPGGEDGWTRVKSLRLLGIDFTSTPGIASASVGTESHDGAVLVESFTVTGAPVAERDFSADQRDKAAASGAAMPDRSFPIYTAADLANAIRLVGHAKDPAAAKRHIIRRARALGLTAKLPEDWQSSPDAALSDDAQGDIMAESLAHEIAAAVAETPSLPTDSTPSESIGEAIASSVADAASASDAKIAALEAEIARLTAEHAQPVTEEEEATPSVEDDGPVTEAVATLESAVTALTEAGRSLSMANKAKIKAAHDVLAGMSGMDCAPDSDMQSAPGAPISEQALVTLVAEAVETAVKAERKKTRKLVEKLETEHQRTIDEMLKARRKTKGITERDLSVEAQLDTMSLSELLALQIGRQTA